AQDVEYVEQDVEAPDVFQATDMGLWDGRPSLGGVWVAHPDVVDPERVIIRNTENGNFVIGALFRRERSSPGPSFQVSSDAATELGMLAGQPGELDVVVLRREQVPVEVEPTEEMATAIGEPETIEATSIDPIASAAAAIDAAEDGTEAAADAMPGTAEVAEIAPAPSPTPSSLDKPFIQIGIFSVEDNANNTATSLRTSGLIPRVSTETLNGKSFWRVVVGPAANSSERSALLSKVQELGFEDAYFVTD
ncbi:MAG TPA: SPOR domain-containing protein, partial [Chromatiaceae bacterium]|nr:SPOR domain-containing protein [Chromatiaceae bacterium]